MIFSEHLLSAKGDSASMTEGVNIRGETMNIFEKKPRKPSWVRRKIEEKAVGRNKISSEPLPTYTTTGGGGGDGAALSRCSSFSVAHASVQLIQLWRRTHPFVFVSCNASASAAAILDMLLMLFANNLSTLTRQRRQQLQHHHHCDHLRSPSQFWTATKVIDCCPIDCDTYPRWGGCETLSAQLIVVGTSPRSSLPYHVSVTR